MAEDNIARFLRVHEALGFLISIQLGFIQNLLQGIWCTTLSIAIVVIVIYFTAILSFIIFSANCSDNTRVISERFIPFLGALAVVLLLVVIFPAFGWFTLLVWGIVLTKCSYQMIAEVQYGTICSALIGVLGSSRTWLMTAVRRVTSRGEIQNSVNGGGEADQQQAGDP